MSKIIDISLTLDGNIPIFPGNPDIVIRLTETIEHDGCNVSEISMGCHTGTHIDAPSHFIRDGNSASDLPLDALVGEAVVIEIKDPESIKTEEIREHFFKDHQRVLFKTRNSGFIHSKEFREDYVYLSPQAAEFLAGRGVRLVGIDYLSINQYNADQETHRVLLSRGIVIIEGLDLSEVQQGEYELIALPIKLPTDGAPARVLLRY